MVEELRWPSHEDLEHLVDCVSKGGAVIRGTEGDLASWRTTLDDGRNVMVIVTPRGYQVNHFDVRRIVPAHTNGSRSQRRHPG